MSMMHRPRYTRYEPKPPRPRLTFRQVLVAVVIWAAFLYSIQYAITH